MRGEDLQDAHLVPLRNDPVHVGVADKEGDNAVGDGAGQLNQHAAIIADDVIVFPHIEFCADGHLVGAACQHHRAEAVPASERSFHRVRAILQLKIRGQTGFKSGAPQQVRLD